MWMVHLGQQNVAESFPHASHFLKAQKLHKINNQITILILEFKANSDSTIQVSREVGCGFLPELFPFFSLYSLIQCTQRPVNLGFFPTIDRTEKSKMRFKTSTKLFIKFVQTNMHIF